ncbi:MAG: peptidase [Oscillospiraceae bacterium]|nr:peptidase [Oscillospiraceae bacterium]
MNKDRMQGFAAGMLACLLVLGAGGSVLAAGRTIQVEDGITVTINGAKFSPRDVTGKEVPLFAYEGTTYAPIRALCEAAGLEVNYDTATGTAILTTGDMALAADPKAASYISAARARELALQHAGVSAADTVFLKSKLDWDHDHTCYEVEFYCGDTEYDYELDAVTGAVLNYSHELDCYDIHYSRGGHHAEKGGHHGASAGTDLISQEQAQAIALDRAPAGAVVVKCKLDWDEGRYVYEVELRGGSAEYECDIHAVTGVILKWDVDWD